VALDIEFHRQLAGKLFNVTDADMALVRPGVHGNPFCTRSNGELGKYLHVGEVALARIANERNFIEVHTQGNHLADSWRYALMIVSGCSGTSSMPLRSVRGDLDAFSSRSCPSRISANTV